MENEQAQPENNWHWKKLLNYFLQGLIILAPIAITFWALYSVFVWVDNILEFRYPGIGFALILIFVWMVGYISSFFLMGRAIYIFERLLEKTPGVKLIYSSVKDFFEAFAGNKRKFTKPVLVNIYGDDIWRIGFITQEDGIKFGLTNHMAVYVPKSYAFTGDVFFAPVSKIRRLDNIPSAEAMKFALTGGVTEFEEQVDIFDINQVKQVD